MEILYNLLTVSPYIYSIAATIAVYCVNTRKKRGLNIKNAVESVLYVCVSLCFSIAALCVVPYEKYDLLTPIVFSFFLPVLFSALSIWGLYDVTREKRKNNANLPESQSDVLQNENKPDDEK